MLSVAGVSHVNNCNNYRLYSGTWSDKPDCFCDPICHMKRSSTKTMLPIEMNGNVINSF